MKYSVFFASFLFIASLFADTVLTEKDLIPLEQPMACKGRKALAGFRTGEY